MALMERKITERHARALLSLDTEELQMKVARRDYRKRIECEADRSKCCFLQGITRIKKSKRISFTKDVRLAFKYNSPIH